MRIRVFIGFVILLFSCSTDRPSNTQETDHFVIKWEEGQASVSEIEEAKVVAEEVFRAYKTYFGSERLPQKKTVINLGGNAFGEEGEEPKIPYANENGEIFLFRFDTGYFGELPHEYVHILRFYSGWSSDGFLEEGLAETMSATLFPENVGFSLYGFSSTVAAGLWFQENTLIPLQELKDRHFDLNLNCLPQSYSLRADFFAFILDEYGKERFFDFIYASDAGTYEVYERIFEKKFSELEEQWLLSLQQRLNADSQSESQITAYKSKIDDLQFFICTRGIDF